MAAQADAAVRPDRRQRDRGRPFDGPTPRHGPPAGNGELGYPPKAVTTPPAPTCLLVREGLSTGKPFILNFAVIRSGLHDPPFLFLLRVSCRQLHHAFSPQQIRTIFPLFPSSINRLLTPTPLASAPPPPSFSPDLRPSILHDQTCRTMTMMGLVSARKRATSNASMFSTGRHVSQYTPSPHTVRLWQRHPSILRRGLI